MKKTIICSALAFLGIQANAQVEDVSVTLSPTASYNWFDNNSAIKDGLMIGGRVGFGFGEYFELRALYEKSVDLKSEIDKLDIKGEDWKKFTEKFESRNVDVERIGGEMKANIPTGGALAPYVTLGSGVQKLKHDGLKDEQIYLSLGLGTKVNLSDRVVLNLEGKNTAYNLNRANVLFQEAGKSELEKALGDSRDDRMYNWSVLAGLQFYLGGREPGTLTELDRAYLRKFSGGLSGFKFVVEPGVAQIKFNDDLNLRDTYLVGGTAGFDFNQFIGLRGFYYQATQNEEFKKFDDLAMYGADIVARLNVARGLTPYITLGGGYLNAYSSYEGERPSLVDPSSYFVKGGLGLNVPIGTYLDVFGAANLLYTTNVNDAEGLKEIQRPSELKQSQMYNVGLRFKLGAPANEDAILERKLNSDKQVYKDRISELEAELQRAYKENDSDKAVRVIKEKQELEKGYQNGDRVVLTPKELGELVSKTIDEVNEEYTNQKSRKESGDVNQRIDRLERLLLEVNRNDYNNYQGGNLQNNATQEILNELRDLNSKVDRNSDKISMLAGTGTDDNTVVVAPSQPATVAPAGQAQVVQGQTTTPQVVTNEEGETGVVKSMFVNEGISIDLAPIFGGGTSGAIGIRGHYGFTNSNWEIQPNLYVGVAGKGSFGANANAIYKFNIDRGFIVQPYLGAGLGYNKLDDDSSFGANLVVGTSFNVLDGKLYVDYTALNLADFNKISVGYKFGL
ncbi:outer membrane beta-barrel protein [Ornithobacterium rhinotracheale]|uniref:outer membrane beta-barrel protein n=1 Tax=Ornithobacterium rhinotracheale TaxID=28251 RepID=UPI0040352BA7